MSMERAKAPAGSRGSNVPASPANTSAQWAKAGETPAWASPCGIGVMDGSAIVVRAALREMLSMGRSSEGPVPQGIGVGGADETAQAVRATVARMRQCADERKCAYGLASLEHAAGRLTELLGKQVRVHE